MSDFYTAKADFTSVYDAIERWINWNYSLEESQNAIVKITETIENGVKSYTATVSKLNDALGEHTAVLDIVNDKAILHKDILTKATEAVKRYNEALTGQKKLDLTRPSYSEMLISEQMSRMQESGTLKTGSPKELFGYKSAIADLQEFLLKNQELAPRFEEIWGNVRQGIFAAYTGSFGDLQSKIYKVIEAQNRLGTDAVKQDELIASGKIALIEDEKARILAIERLAQVSTQEHIAEITHQKQIIALEQERIALNNRLATIKENILSNIYSQVPMGQASLKASYSVSNALGNLKDFLTKYPELISKVQGMYQDINAGKFGYYGGIEQDLQTKIYKVVTAQAAVTGEIDRANAELVKQKKLEEESKQEAQNIVLTWRSIGRILVGQVVRRIFIQLVQGMVASIATARDFSLRIAEIQTVSQQAQLTTSQWSDGLLRLSNAFGVPILDQTEAAYQAISNQVVAGAESFRFLADANIFAATTVSSSADAINLLSSALNAYGLTTADTNRIASNFFMTIKLGRLRASDIANSIGTVAVQASQLGIKVEELNAVLATLTVRGVSPNAAMTQMRGIILKLLKPTAGMKELLKSIGVESGEAAIQTFGFTRLLDILQEKCQGSAAEIAKMFTELRGMSGMIGLTGKNLQTFTNTLEQMKNAEQEYANAQTLIFESAGKRLQIQINKLKNTFISDIGEPITEILAWIGELISPVGLPALTTAIYAVSAAITASLIPALAKLLKIGIGVTSIHPYVTIIALITTAIAAYVSMYKQYYDNLEDAINKENELRIANISKVKNIAKRELEIQKDSIDKRVQFELQGSANVIANLEDYIQEQIKNHKYLDNEVKEITKDIASSYSQALTKIKNQYNDFIRSAERGHQEIKDLIESTNNELLDLQIVNLPVDQQFAAIQKRIKDVIIQMRKYAEEGNVDQVSKLGKMAEKLQHDLLKVQSDADKENKNNAKNRSALNKKIAKEDTDYAIKRQELEQKYADAKKKQDREAQKNIQRDLATLSSVHQQKINDLNNEYKTIKDINFKRLNDAREIIDLTAERIRLLDDASRKAEENAKKAEQERYEYERIQDQISIISKRTAAFTDIQLIKAENLEDLKNLYDQEKQDLQDSIRLGLNDHNAKKLTTDQVQVLRDKLLDIDKIYQRRSAQLQQQELNKEIQKTAKELDDILQLINDQKASMAELHQTIVEDFDKLVKTASGRIPTKNYDLILKLLQYQRVLKEGKLKILPQDFFNTLKQVESIITQKDPIERIIGTKKDVTDAQIAIKQLTVNGEKYNKSQEELKTNQDKTNKALEELKILGSQVTHIFNDSTIAVQTLTENLDDLIIKIDELKSRYEGLHSTIRVNQMLYMNAPEQFATGGFVGTDRVPALLSPGEFVMSAKATRRFFSQLVAMNGAPQHFAGGGPVSNFGDINVSLVSSGNASLDAVAIAKAIKREIRRGTIK